MDIKRFYAIQCKKFLALFLSLVFLVTTVLSPSIVLADNDPYVFKPEYTKIQGLMDYVMSGVMGVFPGDFNTFYQNNKQAYDDWYNKVYGYNYTGTGHSGGGKKLTVKADDLKEFQNIVKNQLYALNGYFVIVPSATPLRSYLLSTGKWNDDDKLSSICSDQHSKQCFVGSDAKVLGFENKCSMFYLDSNGNAFCIFSYGKYDFSRCKIATPDFPYFVDNYTLSTKRFTDSIYFGDSIIKVFYSRSDFIKWCNKGNSSVYMSSKFYNYSPTDITINSQSVKNYTENNITEKIYNETVNNVWQTGGTDGEAYLTQEQVQKIVDDAVQKVLAAMPTPTPEPTDTPTPTPTPGTGTETDTPTPTPTPGGDSGGTPDSSTKEFFQKICDYFEENNKKLEDIINLLDTAGKSDCNYNYSELSDFLSTLWNESDKKFDTMISLLEKNNTYQEKMLDSLNQIKALLVVDSVLDVFKDRSSETANKAKEKFPTSVPWDVAMIVNAMSAEPQAPVMKIPLVLEQFGISEEVTIDLSSDEWEKLAKLCRYLLSLLFLLFMVHLTRKLFYKDGDD